MSEIVIVAIIAAIPGTVAAFAAWDARRRADAIHAEVAVTRKAVEEVHVIVNNRLTQLLAATGAAEHAAGMAAERDLEAERQRYRDATLP